MGHLRLGRLPRTQKWKEVIGLVDGGGSAAQVADATIDAAEDQLEEGITVVSATVDMDRYAVVGTIRRGGQELAAAWDDGEWRRIAGWLRRG